MHLAKPEAATRTALITTPLTTKADALAALSLIETDGEDRDLNQRLIGKLREFIAAA